MTGDIMAKLPQELMKLSGLGDEARGRLDRLYEKLNGLCRWFGVGLNGILFAADEGDACVDGALLRELAAGRSDAEIEHLCQFIEELRAILADHGAAYEGTFEMLDPETIAEGAPLVRAAYAFRPFWRWY
jgi:hypothetical protein